jgi:hypothetical protein
MTAESHPRSFWLLLLFGILLRSVALNQPLLDAHLLRQCQTAAATQSLIAQPGLPLSSSIPWLGDDTSRYILELPLYNYLTIGVFHLTGQLDLSGKLVSILLWALSFYLLQAIWRRLLTPQQACWANALFVAAPLSVFYGQTFMPEMLVQVLALGFVVLLLRYEEKPTLSRWTACAAVGLAGLLVKLPEVAHLYLILMFLVWRREGWKGALRPRYLVAALLSVVALKVWGGYVDAVNRADLPEWTSQASLRGFIGPLALRFQARPWIMIGLYLWAFVATGPALLATMWGLRVILREKRAGFLALWLLSLVVYYVLWLGNGGAAQSYYNLPALGPICALFGIGLESLLATPLPRRWPRLAASTAVVLLVGSVAPVIAYLFRQDRTIYEAALWIRNHTAPEEVVIFRPQHRYDMTDYPFNPVPAYYSGRQTFVWAGAASDPRRDTALAQARHAIVTLPPPPPSGLVAKLQRWRGSGLRQLAPLDWLEQAGFVRQGEGAGFVIYEHPRP